MWASRAREDLSDFAPASRRGNGSTSAGDDGLDARLLLGGPERLVGMAGMSQENLGVNRSAFDFWSSGDAVSVHSSIEGAQRRGWWQFWRSREGGRGGRQLAEVGGGSEELAMFRSPNSLDEEAERRRGEGGGRAWGRACQRMLTRLVLLLAVLALLALWICVAWQKTLIQAAVGYASLSLRSANISLPPAPPSSSRRRQPGAHRGGGGRRGWEEWRREVGGRGRSNTTGGAGLEEAVVGFAAEIEVDVGRLGQSRLGATLSLPPWTLSLHVAGCSLGVMSLPPTKLRTPLRPFSSAASLTIHDFQCFDVFVRAMATEAAVALRLAGKVSLGLHFAGLTLLGEGLELDKTLSLPGMQGMPGATLSHLDLSKSTAAAVIGEALTTLHNPSIFQLFPAPGLGLEVSFAGSPVGTFYTAQWGGGGLVRGANVVGVRGNFAPRNLSSASTLFSAVLAGRPVAVAAKIVAVSDPLLKGMEGVTVQAELSTPPLPFVSSLSIASLSLRPSPPSPHANASVALSASILVHLAPLLGPSPLTVHSISLPSATLLFGSKRAASFAVLPQQISQSGPHGLDIRIQVQQSADVDPAVFAAMVSAFLQAPSVACALVGDVTANFSTAMGTVSVSGVPLSQVVSLPGANGFKDVSVTALNVAPETALGLPVSVTVSVTNPSTASATLPPASFDLRYEGASLGGVSARALAIAPGPNTLLLQGLIRPSSPAALAALGRFVGRYAAGEAVETEVVGLGCSTPCAPWAQTVLSSLQLKAPITRTLPAPAITSFTLHGAGLGFSESGAALLGLRAEALFSSPFPGLHLTLTAVALRLTLQTHSARPPFASLNTPLLNVTCDPARQRVELAVPPTPLSVSDMPAFQDFVQATVEEEYMQLELRGEADARASFLFGDLLVAGLPLNISLRLKAFGGLKGGIKVDNIQVLPAASPLSLPVSLIVRIFNPSLVSIHLGDLAFALHKTACLSGPDRFGSAFLRNASLAPGWNDFAARGVYNASASAGGQGAMTCGEQFLSEFVNNQSSNVTLQAEFAPSGIPLVQQILRRFAVPVLTAGLQKTLVAAAQVLLRDPLAVLRTGKIHAQVRILNPLQADIQLRSLHLALALHSSSSSPSSSSLGTVALDLAASPLLIPAGSELLTPALCLNVSHLLSPGLLKAFLEAAASPHGAQVDVVGPVEARLGGNFSARLHLNQGPISAKIVFQQPPPCWPYPPPVPPAAAAAAAAAALPL